MKLNGSNKGNGLCTEALSYAGVHADANTLEQCLKLPPQAKVCAHYGYTLGATYSREQVEQRQACKLYLRKLLVPGAAGND